MTLRRSKEEKLYIPHEIAEKHLLEEKSLVRAWREYKGLSQGEVAKRMGISQAAYSQMERTGSRLRNATREKIARALGVGRQQLEG